MCRLRALRITPIVNAPTSALPTFPRSPANAAPPMITAVIESSSARSPVLGDPGIHEPRGEEPADAGRETAQGIDGHEHTPDRDPDAARGVGIPADRVQPAAPHEVGGADRAPPG